MTPLTTVLAVVLLLTASTRLVVSHGSGVFSTWEPRRIMLYEIPLEQALDIARTAMSAEFGGRIERIEKPYPGWRGRTWFPFDGQEVSAIVIEAMYSRVDGAVLRGAIFEVRHDGTRLRVVRARERAVLERIVRDANSVSQPFKPQIGPPRYVN